MEATVVAQLVKNLPAMQVIQVQSLGWEDPLEKGMATHSSILAWKIPWTEEPGGFAKSRTQLSDLTTTQCEACPALINPNLSFQTTTRVHEPLCLLP